MKPRLCRNPICRELLEPLQIIALCPSCRLAGVGGATLAFLVSLIVHLVR